MDLRKYWITIGWLFAGCWFIEYLATIYAAYVLLDVRGGVWSGMYVGWGFAFLGLACICILGVEVYKLKEAIKKRG